MGEALRLEIADTDIAMTFFDNRPSGALEADDIARAVMFALTHPPHVDVNELLIRPKPI